MPVKARQMRMAWKQASVPLVVKRTLLGAGHGLRQRFGQHDRLIVVGKEGAALLHGLDNRFYHVPG